MTGKIPIRYDGSRGPEVLVQFRNPARAARFAAGETKEVPEAEARDLLNPLCSGGGFSRVHDIPEEQQAPPGDEQEASAPAARPRRKVQSGGAQ